MLRKNEWTQCGRMLALLNYLEEAFKENAIAAKKPQMEAYMKSKFTYYGLPSPVRKETSKPFLKEMVAAKLDIEETAKLLWAKKEREWHYFAIDYLIKCHKQWQPKHIELFKYLTVINSWWDTVDAIATNLIGALLLKFPELKPNMDNWIDDENMWMNRVAIIHQLKYRDKTDVKRLFVYCKKHAASKEFFHQKAIGWALRELAKQEPQTVINFVNSTVLAPLSKREALKHLK